MRHLIPSPSIVALVTVLLAGCGGGGSSTIPTAAVDCPSAGSGSPAIASYAGTYSCTGPDVSFTAVLPTANGNFSSCSGLAVKTLAVSCHGSIGSDGTFNVTGTDSEGNALTFVGNATATAVCGSEQSPAGANTFQCQH